MPDYTTGILLICLGNLCAATGLTLMKSSTVHEGEKPFFLRWRWLAGFSFLGVLTTVVDVYVLGFLPLSVVAPFAGLTIVFTLAIASTGLLNEPEPLRHTDVIGIGFIIVGEVVVSVFGPHSSHGLTSAEIMADAQKPVFAAFAAASMATVLTWVALGMLPAARERCLRAAAEAGGAASLLATAPSAYSAAVCGALSQLFVKVVAVTANAAGGDFTGAGSPWRQLPPYLALVGLVVTAPLQLSELAPTGAAAAATDEDCGCEPSGVVVPTPNQLSFPRLNLRTMMMRKRTTISISRNLTIYSPMTKRMNSTTFSPTSERQFWPSRSTPQLGRCGPIS